jgi:hypothetical protein
VAAPYLSRVITAPGQSAELLRELAADLRHAGARPALATLICRDVLLGAVLRFPTLHIVLHPETGPSPAARPGRPFYVDGYYFTRALPEPPHSVFVMLADGGLAIVLRRFPELLTGSEAVADPLLRAAVQAQVPMQPREKERRLTPVQRVRKLLLGSVIDDVFSAVALVVGAEQSLAGDLAGARQVILANLASLRLPALMDREHLVRVWKLRAPFNTDDGRMSGIPVIERTGSRFSYPDATSCQSLCVGMYPITEPAAAFGEIGGYPAFRDLMGPGVRELAEGLVQYRLADMDIANICACADRFWRAPGPGSPRRAPTSCPGGRSQRMSQITGRSCSRPADASW